MTLVTGGTRCAKVAGGNSGRRGMMRNRLALLAVAVFALPVAVAGAAIDVEVVIDYGAPGEQPEGVAVDKRGDVFVTFPALGEVRKVDPSGSESLYATLPASAGFGPLGLRADASGTLYVAVSTFDPATRGVYTVTRDGDVARLPGTGAIVFPNDVTFDKRGNLYVADTILGAVWRVPAGGGPAQLWFQSALLEGSGIFGFGFPLGANGIIYRQNALVVANTEGGRLVRIPIEPDGSPGTGTFDVHGNIWAAVIGQSTIVKVAPSGSVTTFATAADGLDWASSLAFGKNGDLWAVNFAIGPPGGPGPALLRFGVDVSGQPIP
jgi:sugar lactone lactonase YvrE